MRNTLRERNVYRWAAELVGELAQVRLANNSNNHKAGDPAENYLYSEGRS